MELKDFNEVDLEDYKTPSYPGKKKLGPFGYWGDLLYKIAHPGNTLTVAFILLGIGLCLIAAGVACPPALILASLFLSNLAALSAMAYGLHWLITDYRQYKKIFNSYGLRKNYLIYCLNRLQKWGEQHPWQRFFMGVGLVLFLTALILVAGYAVAPLTFGFMAAGAYGGAIGLVSQVFASPFYIGATLILGPVNILDTLRRLCSGIWKRLGGGSEGHGSSYSGEDFSDGVGMNNLNQFPKFSKVGSSIFSSFTLNPQPTANHVDNPYTPLNN